MTTCPGCSRPIEPLAQIRTYHTSCDPQGRVEMLEKVLAPFAKFAEGMSRIGRPHPQSGPVYCITVGGADLVRLELTVEDFKAARAALEYRPAQMKGRE